jgi:flagella basal body P-ring formation protein FlgA
MTQEVLTMKTAHVLRQLAVALSLCATAAWAQTAASPPADGALRTLAQQWLDGALEPARAKSPLRMEVEVGSLDARLTLAPCAQVEPYLPPGTNLWGKTRLGVRCLQGSRKWNVFLPINVHAYGPAWVLKSPVMPGTVLSADDVMEKEVDWAESTSPVVAREQDWLGKSVSRLLPAGQTLRQDMLKAAQAFAAGSQVRVLAQGSGFEIVTSAQAVSAGVVGQSIRLRMDNGRVINGWVMDERTVKVQL